ncbi:aminotransferase class I/II-fold pyridoxal phosphate-dependent enzyme [Bacillus spongiae]|uniref:Aminotransferase class I/II-fold pyridoxal phosphate-dependent enzyme n=1 Tax=Bacillus spongiae TaxID=2683610 RepID=A0ABU8HEU7_9BACI
MSGREQKYINEAFSTNWIAPLGPNVDAFEAEFSSYVGVKGAVAVSSGTAAIHLALSILGVTNGDTVFCSTFTFVASANPIVYQGAEPVFIDSEPDTWNMSPQALRRALQEAERQQKLPKAVIIVHLYGQSAKMDELLSICKQYEIPVIEDSAESLGSLYKGKASGTFGQFGIYSFNGNKIITTSGGGMLVSDDEALLRKARFLATQAKDPAVHYQHSEIGYNYRLSNLLAGVGRGQLEVIEDRVKEKRDVFERYENALSHFATLSFMQELEGTYSNRWLTTLTVAKNKAGITPSYLIEVFGRENIEARPVWKPLHMQPLFKNCSYYPHGENEHVAEELFQTGLCLPSGSNLSNEEQNRVIQCLEESLSLPVMA